MKMKSTQEIEKEVIDFIMKHDKNEIRERLEALSLTELCLIKASITD